MNTQTRKEHTILNVRLSTETKEKVRHFAEAQEISMTDLILLLIDALPEPDKTTTEQQRRAFYRLLDLRNVK